MQQPPKKFDQLPLGQQAQVTRNLMPYVALTVMAILRKNMGPRIIDLNWMFGVTLFEIVVSVLFPNGGRSDALFYFALATFALGIYHKYSGWRRIDRGDGLHSFYMGDSRLAFKWLPELFRRNRRTERFIEPICIFLFGTLLLLFLPLMGFFLTMSAACLRVFEAEVYEREKNQRLDIRDGLINSEIQGQIVEQFEGPTNPTQQPSGPCVQTGMADDIQENIKRRKAKQTTQQKG